MGCNLKLHELEQKFAIDGRKCRTKNEPMGAIALKGQIQINKGERHGARRGSLDEAVEHARANEQQRVHLLYRYLKLAKLTKRKCSLLWLKCMHVRSASQIAER